VRHASLPATALEQAIPSQTGSFKRRTEADPVLSLLPLSRMERWVLEHVDGVASFRDLWSRLESERRAGDELVRAAITLHALGAIEIDIPRLTPATSETPVAPESHPEFNAPRTQAMEGNPAQLLLALWRDKATGILELNLPDNPCLVSFESGQLVGSRGADTEQLETLLAQRGRIGRELVPQIRARVTAGQNIGQVLVELGAIAAPQLHAFVRGELHGVLEQALHLTHVEAAFTRKALPLHELVRHEWDTGHAVVETIRSQGMAQVRRVLPDPEGLIVRDTATAGLVTALPLSPTERNLWNLLCVPRPWRRLAMLDLVSAHDQERALSVLLTLGLVHPAKADSDGVVEELPAASTPVPPLAEAGIWARRSREALALPDGVPVETDDVVPRAVHERVLEEKHELERRLRSSSSDSAATVSRELYEEVLRDRARLKAKVVALMDEVIRIKSWGSLTSESESEPPPGLDEGSVIAFKRTRS
jgi:hypothetical protein